MRLGEMVPSKKTATVNSRILWVEGRWSGNPSFVSILRNKGFSIDTVSTGKAALGKVKRGGFDLVVVNAASMRTSGKRICNSIRDERKALPILLICDEDRVVDKQHETAVRDTNAGIGTRLDCDHRERLARAGRK